MMLLVNGPSGAFVKFFVRLAFTCWQIFYVVMLHCYYSILVAFSKHHLSNHH